MRCDRCARAHIVRYWHAETKAELRLCAVHDREHGGTLLARGWVGCAALADLSADPATH